MRASFSNEFASAYVAMGYYLGRRGDELHTGLQSPHAPSALVRALSSSDKNHRARALAAQLLQLAQAIKRERL